MGAYLLSLWRLPYSVVEAVAHLHHQRRIPANGMDMVLLLYATNLLAHEREALENGLAPPEFDMELLKQAGLDVHLPEWRKIAEAAQPAATQLVG